MNLERFEHELVKIKQMVGPEFVGLPGRFSDGRGQRCIMGQIMFNCGVPEEKLGGVIPIVNRDGTRERFYGDSDWGGALFLAVRRAVEMNNRGCTWHEIVDALVPETKQIEFRELVA